MIYVAATIVIALPILLLITGMSSEKRTVEFYHNFFTRSELEKLADAGSDIARKALAKDC